MCVYGGGTLTDITDVDGSRLLTLSNHLIKPDLFIDTPVFVRGEGVELIDDKGCRYLDAAAGVGVTCLGYGVTEVVDAMHDQAEQLPYLHALRFEAPPSRE